MLGYEFAGADCELEDVLEATSYVTPAIEILDTRIHMKDPDTGSTRTIVDTVADNAADAGIIVAHQRFDVHEIDIPWVAAVLRRNGRIEESAWPPPCSTIPVVRSCGSRDGWPASVARCTPAS